jgi:hypothetical protein
VKRRRKLVAAIGIPTLAAAGLFGTMNAFADEIPSDGAIVKACAGDQSGMPSGTAVTACSYDIAQVISKETVKTGVSKLFVDNCAGTKDAGIEGTGSYAQSRSWTISLEGSLNVGTFLSVAGGASYSQGDETAQAITGTFTVSPGNKAQIVYGQEFDNVQGTFNATVTSVDPDGNQFTDRFSIQREGKLPVAGARGAIAMEEVACSQSFQSPVGNVRFEF